MKLPKFVAGGSILPMDKERKSTHLVILFVGIRSKGEITMGLAQRMDGIVISMMTIALGRMFIDG